MSNGASEQAELPPVVAAVWGEEFTDYDFGPSHPMAPIRLELTARLCEQMGVFDRVTLISPPVPDDAALAKVATAPYLAAVKAASIPGAQANLEFGLGTDDCPTFEGMHEASARIVGGSVALAEQLWAGEIDHGVNFTGGMHHASIDRASGFCIYNDAAAAIMNLLEAGARKVAYIDVDVHHGDGVEEFFKDDPRVLTASLHESGRTLFPGTGWPADIGQGEAAGTVVNCALPMGVSDSAWLLALESALLPAVRAFAPDVIVSQHGCDTHLLDPLAHMAITVDGQKKAAEYIHRLSHEICQGRWLALGGGGYDTVQVVPRAWTHLTAIATHEPIPSRLETPQPWRDLVTERTTEPAPTRMGDVPEKDLPIWVQPWEMGFNPHSDVDRAIMATREAVFPALGLDVWFND